MNRFVAKVLFTVGACLASGAPLWAQDTGVIKGKIVFKGDPAAYSRVEIDTSKDPNCGKDGKKIGTENVVLNKKTTPVTVRNVLVSIKEGLGDRKYTAPTDKVVLDQKGCHYEPHVLALMEGQPLTIRNSDDTNHNIHFLPKVNEEVNVTQPQKGMEKDVKLVKEDVFKVKCDVHPWMGCHIAVFTHPFFFVTKEEGTFELKNVPPGKYKVEAWHETFGTLSMDVEVATGATVEKDLTFEPK